MTASEKSTTDVEVLSCLHNMKINESETHNDMFDEDESYATKRWLDWCRSHAWVKTVEYDVPPGILPKNYRGIVTDVKVGGKKRVPDDKIYIANQDLREKVARGNTVLQLNRIDKGKIVETKYIFLVFALKKFSGGMGDEDDSAYEQSEWEHYFVRPMDTATKVISTEKANGEAGHVSARRFFGRNYYCIGSKNVHMLVCDRVDITKYTDGRFQFAKLVAESFFTTYLENPEIPEHKKELFITFIQTNKYTSVYEMIQPKHQHVVNLNYLNQPELRFICWTQPDYEQDFCGRNTLCALPVNEAINKARGYGLTTIEYEVAVSSGGSHFVQNVEDYMLKIRKDTGYEGKVLYFLDCESFTIGLIKKKTAWYVILRAMREKIATFGSSNKSLCLSERCNMTKKRIKTIQTWLGFSDTYANHWIEISSAFVSWISSAHSRYYGAENVRSRFPIVFDEFLNDVQNEKFKSIYESLRGTF